MGLMAVIGEGVMHRRAVGWLMENVKTVEVDDFVEGESRPVEDTKKKTKKRASKKKDEAAPKAGDETSEAAPEANAE
jgi:hypothetical protein